MSEWSPCQLHLFQQSKAKEYAAISAGDKSDARKSNTMSSGAEPHISEKQACFRLCHDAFIVQMRRKCSCIPQLRTVTYLTHVLSYVPVYNRNIRVPSTCQLFMNRPAPLPDLRLKLTVKRKVLWSTIYVNINQLTSYTFLH